MTEQEKFDEFIGRTARTSDPVPETPRDEMWSAISAARASQHEDITAAATAATAATADVIPFAPKQLPRTHAWLQWAVPLAAMLVIGVGLGRISTRASRSADTTNTTATATQQTVANATSTQRPQDSTAAGLPGGAKGTPDKSLETLSRPPIVAVAPQNTTGFTRAVKSNRSRMASNGAVVRENDNATRSSASTMSYRVAASNHFARVQTLLVSLPDDARDGHINEIAVRAADLLVNTRLLLDSPAARDTETKRMLDDLELILAQVATISPTHSAEDVQIIQDAITKRDVLLRLRAMTAGQRLSGT